jgi:hypothetical protein
MKFVKVEKLKNGEIKLILKMFILNLFVRPISVLKS